MQLPAELITEIETKQQISAVPPAQYIRKYYLPTVKTLCYAPDFPFGKQPITNLKSSISNQDGSRPTGQPLPMTSIYLENACFLEKIY